MIRIVADTNVIVSGLLWSGSPSRLLAAVFDGKMELASSWAILDELLEVLARPKLASRLEHLGVDPVGLTFDFLTQCRIVDALPIARTAPDLQDDMVIGTALSANSDYVVTGDKPLLGLGQIETVRFVTVAEALALIGL